MYATGKFLRKAPTVGELQPVMSLVSVLPSGGGHAIRLRLFDGPAQVGKALSVHMTPREARQMAQELTEAAEQLSPARPVITSFSELSRLGNVLAERIELDGVDRARMAAAHYLDKCDDPGHGEGSECETCLYHLANG